MLQADGAALRCSRHLTSASVRVMALSRALSSLHSSSLTRRTCIQRSAVCLQLAAAMSTTTSWPPPPPPPARPPAASSLRSTPLPPHLSSLPPHLLERDLVHSFYDTIATHFSHTRHSPWPRVEAYVTSLPSGCRVLDVGCGNGKYMGVNPSLRMIGCDISERLVAICRQKGFEAEVGDCQLLRWPDGEFDCVICVALMHHLSSEERRLQALREMLRVLRVGGELLVTAWAQEQEGDSRRRFDTQDVLVPWTLPQQWQEGHERKEDEKQQQSSGQSAEGGAEEQQVADGNGSPRSSSEEVKRVPREKKRYRTAEERKEAARREEERRRESDLIVHRYCHVYVEGELEALLSRLPSCRLLDRYYDKGNWVMCVQKTSDEQPEPPRIPRSDTADASEKQSDTTGECVYKHQQLPVCRRRWMRFDLAHPVPLISYRSQHPLTLLEQLFGFQAYASSSLRCCCRRRFSSCTFVRSSITCTAVLLWLRISRCCNET